MNEAGERDADPDREMEDDSNNETQQQQKAQKKHTWTVEHTKEILSHLANQVRNKKPIEKPKAPVYYAKYLAKNRENEDLTLRFPPRVTPKTLKDHVNNWRKKYKDAVKWSNVTGQGVRREDGEKTFREDLLQMCAHYDLCDEIWGTRQNIHIPSSRETTRVGRGGRRGPLAYLRLHTPAPEEHFDEDENTRERSRSPANFSPASNRAHHSPPASPLIQIQHDTSPFSQLIDNNMSQGSSRGQVTPQRAPETTSGRRRGPPGRNMDKAAERLNNIGSSSSKSYKDLYEDVRHKTIVRESESLKVERDRVRIEEKIMENETRRLDEELELRKAKFEYQRSKDTQALEMEREITRRKEIELEEMKIRLEIARLQQQQQQ